MRSGESSIVNWFAPGAGGKRQPLQLPAGRRVAHPGTRKGRPCAWPSHQAQGLSRGKHLIASAHGQRHRRTLTWSAEVERSARPRAARRARPARTMPFPNGPVDLSDAFSSEFRLSRERSPRVSGRGRGRGPQTLPTAPGNARRGAPNRAAPQLPRSNRNVTHPRSHARDAARRRAARRPDAA